jgi:hypothetical protein
MKFDYTSKDTQATAVEPVKPENFNLNAYEAYETAILNTCRTFWYSDSGVAVYRRFRVAEVFAYGCRDMERSLQLQLGALERSIRFKADIPNFLEPWYGIGTAASAFGMEYIWQENLAPAMKPGFQSVPEVLQYDRICPIRETEIGKFTLDTIDYFLGKTKGRIPMSLCDVQSPLNAAGYIVDINQFLMDCLLYPAEVKTFMETLADLIIDFTNDQLRLLDKTRVWPGHGFASSRVFEGFGASDDNILMMDDDLYQSLAVPAMLKLGNPFGGPVFHSCGDWISKVEIVKNIPGLKMADGAFTKQTDPSPNSPEIIGEAFANTGIALCARMVGDADTVINTVKKIWHPGLKLIVVTYIQSPEEQEKVYNLIHDHCI